MPKHVVILYVINYTYLYHHLVVLDKYTLSNLVVITYLTSSISKLYRGRPIFGGRGFHNFLMKCIRTSFLLYSLIPVKDGLLRDRNSISGRGRDFFLWGPHSLPFNGWRRHFPTGKYTGTWSWPLTPHLAPKWRMCGAVRPLLNMPSRSDAKSYRNIFVYLQSFTVNVWTFNSQTVS